MSAICTIIGNILETNRRELCKELKSSAIKHGWGVYFDEIPQFSYYENFHADLSDNFIYPNCEQLMSTIGESINAYKEKISLFDRIGYICCMTRICLEYMTDVLIFISEDSPNSRDEFEIWEVSDEDLHYSMLKVIKPYSFLPTVCFYVKRNCF